MLRISIIYIRSLAHSVLTYKSVTFFTFGFIVNVYIYVNIYIYKELD